MNDSAPTPAEQGLDRVRRFLELESIRDKILALALAATLIPAVGTAIVSYVQSRRALTENLTGELISRGSQGAREVDLWIKERTYDVRVFTASFEVLENVERIQLGDAGSAESRARLNDYLGGVFGRFTDYSELRVADLEGQILASTEDGLAGASTGADRIDGLPDGGTAVGEPYWDDARARVSASVAVPVNSADARPIGVLAATLTFDAVTELLADLTPGSQGGVELLTGDGRLIASSFGDAASFELTDPLDPDVLDRLWSSEGALVEFDDRGDTPVVGTLTPVPDLEWAVVAQIPAVEAFAQVARLRNTTILLVSFLLAVVGSIAYFLGLVIVKPLARLTEGAGAVAAGDFTVDLPGAGRGEVADLTAVFNDMVGKLRASREELNERNQELERLALTDLLTGLHNRRFLLDAFDKEIKRADRHERPFCVLMIDVDRFKQYNDTYGHQAGDDVLRRMGIVLMDATRDLDVPARYGGEEFTVLLPECDVEGAIVAAERIRTRLAKETFEGGPVTISVGAAEFPMHGDSAAAVIAAADAALYDAKGKGRDCVVGAGLMPESLTKAKTSRRTTEAKQKRGTPKKKKAGAPKKKAPPKKKAAAASKAGTKTKTAAKKKA